MPKWIKCSDRLPNENGSYFVISKMGRGSIPFKDGAWGRDHPHMRVFEHIVEWLDEEDNPPSFSIKQLIKIYDDGWYNGNNKRYISAGDYLRTEFNITI